MPVIMLQIKPLFMHTAVDIVLSWRKLSQPGQANGSYAAYNLKNNCQIYSTSDFRQDAISTAMINAILLSVTVRQQCGGSYPPKYPPVAIHKINYTSLANCTPAVISYMLTIITRWYSYIWKPGAANSILETSW